MKGAGYVLLAVAGLAAVWWIAKPRAQSEPAAAPEPEASGADLAIQRAASLNKLAAPKIGLRFVEESPSVVYQGSAAVLARPLT